MENEKERQERESETKVQTSCLVSDQNLNGCYGTASGGGKSW